MGSDDSDDSGGEGFRFLVGHTRTEETKPSARKSTTSAPDKADEEIKQYQEMCIHRDGVFKLECNRNKKINEWWCNDRVQNVFPGLSRVALGFCGMLPGSGALECDIGTITDYLTPKRSSLSPGLVEAMSVVRINKVLVEEDSSKIVKYGNDWQQKIPSREWLQDKEEVASNMLDSLFDDENQDDLNRDDEYQFVQDAEVDDDNVDNNSTNQNNRDNNHQSDAESDANTDDENPS